MTIKRIVASYVLNLVACLTATAIGGICVYPNVAGMLAGPLALVSMILAPVAGIRKILQLPCGMETAPAVGSSILLGLIVMTIIWTFLRRDSKSCFFLSHILIVSYMALTAWVTYSALSEMLRLGTLM